MERVNRRIHNFIILVAVVVFMCLPLIAHAETLTYEDGDGVTWKYQIIPAGTWKVVPELQRDVVEILGCNVIPKDGVLRIPSEIDGIDVASIGKSAFENSPGSRMIKEAIVPEHVLNIGPNAFAECSNLKNLSLPEGLRFIQYEGFSGCAVEELTIPDSVEFLGMRAFGWCDMKTVTIPKNFPFEFPVSDVFYDCNLLQEYRLEDGDELYTTDNGVLYSKDGKTLMAYPAGKYDLSFTVPETVERIDNDAFANTKLRTVELPDGLKSMGTGVFTACWDLTEIRIPGGVKEIPANCFEQCHKLERVELEEGLQTIGDCAFQGCVSLSGLDLPSTVRSIGYGALNDIPTLTHITIPEGVTEVKSNLLSNCMALTSVDLPDSLLSIGSEAFAAYYSEYSALLHLYIPENVQTIDDSAFQNHNPYLTIYSTNSVAEAYAGAHDIDFVYADRETYEQLRASGTIGSPCTEHNLAYREAVEATCISSGLIGYYFCTKCGKRFLDLEGTQEVSVVMTDKKPHTLVHTPAKAATETEEGNLEYWTCSVCGKVFSDENGKMQTDVESMILPKEPQTLGTEASPVVSEKPQKTPAAVVKTIKQTITCPSSYTRTIGSKFRLRAKAKTKLTYRSSNKKVATVDRKGTVTVKDYGRCKIRITAKASGKYRKAVKTIIVRGKLAKPGVKAISKPGKVKLSWTKVKGADGYELYMKLQEESKFRKVLTKSAKVKGVMHRGLTEGKKYSYKVRAFRTVGKRTVYSKYSKAVTVRVK